MKQNITIEQWNELPMRHQHSLWKWQKENEWDLNGTVMSPCIGMMIEFLDKKNVLSKRIEQGENGDRDLIYINTIQFSYKAQAGISKLGLCDALWEATKQVLEKEEV